MLSQGLTENQKQLQLAREKRQKLALHAVKTEEGLCHAIFDALFELIDVDSSGENDVDEMIQCLLLLGLVPARASVERAIEQFDLDRSGKIERGEFSAFMLARFATPEPPPKAPLVDVGARRRGGGGGGGGDGSPGGPPPPPWQVPLKGALHVEFKCPPCPPSNDELTSGIGFEARAARRRRGGGIGG